MDHGILVTVSNHSIRANRKSLGTIGIWPESSTWGVWLPDWRTRYPDQDMFTKFSPDHLLISPFHPKSWPALFRIDLKLENKVGALSQASKVLLACGMNVLSIEATPAGHRHATVAIIAEVIEPKIRLKSKITELEVAEKDRIFKNKSFTRYICKTLAPCMLAHAKRIELNLIKAHEKHRSAAFEKGVEGGFLREAFVTPNKPHPGVLVNPSDLPKRIREFAERQHTRAVTCTWLQNYAFFWLFGTGLKNAMSLPFNGEALLIDASSRADYLKKINHFGLPMKSIATLNLDEHYMRIMFSEKDKEGMTAKVDIPYRVKFSDGIQNTKGLQAYLCHHLSENEFDLRYVSNAITNHSNEAEEGHLRLLLSRDHDGQPLALNPTHYKSIQESTVGALIDIGLPVDGGDILIAKYGAKQMFVSTRRSWLIRKQKTKEKLSVTAAIHGFETVFAYTAEAKPTAHTEDKSKTIECVKLVRDASAFLQIIPIEVLRNGELGWYMFERGVAMAAGVPVAICVETDQDHTLDIWKSHIKVGVDDEWHTFARNSAKKRLISIGSAIAELSNRPRRRPPGTIMLERFILSRL